MATNAGIPGEGSGAVGTRVLISADDIRGTIVHGRDGDKLGTVYKLIIDQRTGHIAYIILSCGGFLGLGQSYHPVPWSAFRYDDKEAGYVAAIDKRLLEGAPNFRPDTAPVFDEAYGQRVTDYFRLPPTPDS